jgi:alkylation response protein AidB-like acyl-CoA dehydrogenase
MEFALTEDQRMLQDSLVGLLAQSASLDNVRAIADGDSQSRIRLDSALSDMGVNQLAVPEAQGGLGLGLLEACLVQEALGAAVAPSRFMSTTMAAAGLKAASTARADAWLAAIATGEMRIGIAIAEYTGARADGCVVSANGQLDGKSLFAMDCIGATHILVADKTGALHLAEAGVNIEITQLSTIDRTRDLSAITFTACASVPLETDAGAASMVAIGRTLLAADTLGVAQAMTDKAVAYALERKQFGRVIASFQAVKHMCAEMAAAIEPSRALIWHAAHAMDEGMDEAALMVCLAKSHLAEVGTFVARTATEVHGGMGFTDLVGLHYWFKRIGANRQLLGGPERVRADAAALQGWA